VSQHDIPIAFIQSQVEKQDKDGHRTIMKIHGPLVKILCEMNPKYKEFVIDEHSRQALYMHIIKALYVLMISANLFYNNQKNQIWIQVKLI